MNTELESDLRSLKELVPKGIEHVRAILAKTAVRSMKNAAQAIFGDKQVIGVFGPYASGGESVIMNLARMVSSLGHVALTGRGFFLQGSNTLSDLGKIMPPPVPLIKRVIPEHIFFREFTQLTNKAIFYENFQRGQFVELEGCSIHDIPVLGFIRHQIINKSRNCNYLISTPSYVECIVQTKDLCQGEIKPRPFFCPFYDAIDIPWFSKQLFMTKENRLVAIRRIISMKKIIQDFLS